MKMKPLKTQLLMLTVLAVLFTSCGVGVQGQAVNTQEGAPTAAVETEAADEAGDSASAAAEPAPTLRPIEPAGGDIDPTSEIDDYMAEGYFISHFDADDIGIWQGYSQDTELIIAGSASPPEGYLNVSGWHAKYTNRWVEPTDGFLLEGDEVIFGDGAGRWSDTTVTTRIVTTEIPTDWTEYLFLSFWLYSAEATNAGIEIVAYSESESTSEDDYYKKEIIIDWEGWRLFEIPLHEFRATREPAGWHQIDYVKIASSGWSHEPDEATDLIFDEMKLSNLRIGARLAVELPADLPHPNLMLNAEEIAQIMEKVEQYDWAARAYAVLMVRADNWLNLPVEVPETGGGFYHADDALAYAITSRHYELADGARDLGLMYQFSGDPAYLEKAREILLAYADVYLSYEIHDKEGRTGEEASAGGRATAQGINEARWVIPLAWAYDLIFNELSEAERAVIEEQLLRPVADLLMENNEGRHNHQTWYNSGVGVIGFVLGDKEYVWYALVKDDSGLAYQLENSITQDGMWYEGSMHYQFYVLRALLPLMEASHHAGFDVYGIPNFKALYDFMLTYADPMLRLPTINDGRVVDLRDSDRLTYFEIAYYRLGDPRYVPVLADSYRTDLNALLYGVPELGEGEELAWQSRHYGNSSLTILRSGAGDDSIQVVLNYMGYQGGHSHADQLSMVLYGLGMTLAPDAGSIKYREPEQEGWFKQTLAHNGLVVDGISQERASAGQLNYFVASPSAQAVSVSSEDVYPGVNLERILLLSDEYLIDIFSADSETVHTYDWVFHNIGRFSTDDLEFTPVETRIGEANGYEYLRNVTAAASDEDIEAEWAIAQSWRLRLNMFGEAGTTFYSAVGPVAADVGDVIAEYPVPVLIARREASSTQFVSIIEPNRDPEDLVEIGPLSLSDGSGELIPPEELLAVQIEHQAGTDFFIFDEVFGDKQTEFFQFNGTWAWLSLDGSALRWVLMKGASMVGDGWAITQEDLSFQVPPVEMGLFVEFAGPGHLFVKSTHEYVSYITLEGFMDSAVLIIELDDAGGQRREIQTMANENGVITFLAQPGLMYEVIGE